MTEQTFHTSAGIGIGRVAHLIDLPTAPVNAVWTTPVADAEHRMAPAKPEREREIVGGLRPEDV